MKKYFKLFSAVFIVGLILFAIYSSFVPIDSFTNYTFSSTGTEQGCQDRRYSIVMGDYNEFQDNKFDAQKIQEPLVEQTLETYFDCQENHKLYFL